MCDAVDEIRGAEASEFCGTTSSFRSVQGEAEADSRGPVEKAGRRLHVGV
jgi:hypothetical protein